MNRQIVTPDRVGPRALEATDATAARLLLADLPRLYPGGDKWLDMRLQDCLQGNARCTLLEDAGGAFAIAIETPKANGALKLSTFFVQEAHSGMGHGSTFARFLARRWRDEGVSDVYVTCDRSVTGRLLRVLAPQGFIHWASVPNRYEEGRTEDVLRAIYL